MARFLLVALLFSLSAFSQCIPIDEVPVQIGKSTCVEGKVISVTEADNGASQISFCATLPCPLIVRVFPIDIEYVGDVRELVGKAIKITGKVRERNGQAEIVLKDADQLQGDAAKLPPIPKTYDVERRGNFSAGQFKGNRTSKRSHKRPPREPSEEIDAE